MDGVIADFDKGIGLWYDITFTEEEKMEWEYDLEAHNLSAKAFWEGLGFEFWESLPWTYTGQILYDSLEDICDPVILTSPPWSSPNAVDGKTAWIKKNTPKIWKEKRFAFASNKFYFAHADTLLIDDKPENVELFVEAGGNAILYPAPWNSNRDINGNDIVDFTMDKLTSYIS